MESDLRTRLERFVALGKAFPFSEWFVGPYYKQDIESSKGHVATTPDTPRGWQYAEFIAAAPQAAEDIAVLLAEGEAKAKKLDDLRERVELFWDRYGGTSEEIATAFYFIMDDVVKLAPQADDQSSQPAVERKA